MENVSESVLQDRVITMVKPVYPPSAKLINATGTVVVQVTISQGGLVVEAEASRRGGAQVGFQTSDLQRRSGQSEERLDLRLRSRRKID